MSGLAIVAGGAGFIGSHLCERLLASGYRVTVVDSLLTGCVENIAPLIGRTDFDLIEGDVTDQALAQKLEPLRPDIIFNLACAASPPAYQLDPEYTMITCVLGTRNYLRLAQDTGARFVLASTSEVYGDPEQSPQREDYRGSVNCTGPRACYDEGKRAAEALAFDFVRLKRCDARVARIFNTYGPRLSPDDGRVVSNFIRQALAGEPLTVYGDGSQTRSLCYVSDTVSGLVALAEADWYASGKPINLGNPLERTIRAIATEVCRAVGTAEVIRFLPLPQDDPRRRCPDIRQAQLLLGWEPKVGLVEGLTETVAWFQSQLQATKVA